jgi:hypothetical protein
LHRHNVTPEDGFDAQLPKPPHLDIRALIGGGDLRLRPHPPYRLARSDAAARKPDDQVALPGHRYFEKKR